MVPRSAGEGPVFRRASQVTAEHEETEKRHEQSEEGERQQTSFRGMRRVQRYDGPTGDGKQDYIAESGAPAKVRAVCLPRSAETLNHRRRENGNKEKEEGERDEMGLTGQAVGDENQECEERQREVEEDRYGSHVGPPAASTAIRLRFTTTTYPLRRMPNPGQDGARMRPDASGVKSEPATVRAGNSRVAAEWRVFRMIRAA